MNRASTDMGNVSQVVPAIHPYIGIGSLPALNHQREFAAHCVGGDAERALLDAATALAWTALDAVHRPDREDDDPPPPAPSTTSLGDRTRFRRPPTGACTPPGPSRTSRSAASPCRRTAHLVAALGAVKQAAVRANRDLGLLDDRSWRLAIDRASQDVRDGLLDDQFVVDVIQGGAGTSTNMNANEVIANRALELLGLPAGALRRDQPARPRQPQPEHQRRLPDRGEARAPAAPSTTWPAAIGELADAFAAKADEFRGRPQGRAGPSCRTPCR